MIFTQIFARRRIDEAWGYLQIKRVYVLYAGSNTPP